MSIMRRQWGLKTCVPACAVYIHTRFRTTPPPWRDLCAVLGTDRTGTDMGRVPMVFDRRWDVKRVRGLVSELKALEAGYLVLSSFITRLNNGHAVVLVGAHLGRMHFYDPVFGLVRRWPLHTWETRRRAAFSFAIKPNSL